MATGKVCPNCHYQRKPDDDNFVPEYECPKCGFIYDKFKPPVTSAENTNKTENVLNTKNLSNSSSAKDSSFKGKRIIYAASLFIVIFIVCIIFIKPFGPVSTSKNHLSGTYTGEVVMDDGERISVEFDIDEQNRVSRILNTRTVNAYQEETFLWEYPDVSQITYSESAGFNNLTNHTSSLTKIGKSFEISIDAPKIGLSVNSTFDINDPENDLPKTEMLNLSSNKDIFYTKFYLMISRPRNLQVSREDVALPIGIEHENLCEYCNTACSEIIDILGDAKRSGQLIKSYQLSRKFNQCSVDLGYSFRHRLKFKIGLGNLNSDLQSILNGAMKRSDLYFYTNDSMIEFETTEQNPLIRISINKKGYGQFGSSKTATNIPVSKIGLVLSDDELNNSTAEWETAFINKKAPNYRTTPSEREQKARRQALEQMKLHGAE